MINFSSNIPQYQARTNNNTPNQNAKIKIGYINDFHGQLTKMERTILPLQECDIRLSGGDNFLGDERRHATLHRVALLYHSWSLGHNAIQTSIINIRVVIIDCQ